MNKSFVITAAATALLALSSVAQAGDSYRRHGDNHYRYDQRSYGQHHRQGGDYRHHRGNRHRGHGRNDFRDGVKIAAGAILLGSIIYAINNEQRRKATHAARSRGPGDFWYRVDEGGRCMEVKINRQGREVWTEVDPLYCH